MPEGQRSSSTTDRCHGACQCSLVVWPPRPEQAHVPHEQMWSCCNARGCLSISQSCWQDMLSRYPHARACICHVNIGCTVSCKQSQTVESGLELQAGSTRNCSAIAAINCPSGLSCWFTTVKIGSTISQVLPAHWAWVQSSLKQRITCWHRCWGSRCSAQRGSWRPSMPVRRPAQLGQTRRMKRRPTSLPTRSASPAARPSPALPAPSITGTWYACF